MSQLCPCGSAVEYSLCCHPYVSGEKVAPDPEHLMRSRYCAFVMQDADYLIKTWHPSCGAAALRAELIAAGFLVFGHLLINSFHLLYECFLPPSRDKYHHS